MKLFQYDVGHKKHPELHVLRGPLMFLCMSVCSYVCNSYAFSFWFDLFGLV